MCYIGIYRWSRISLVSLSSMVQYMIQLIKAQKEIEGNNGTPNKSADNQPASTSMRSGYKG